VKGQHRVRYAAGVKPLSLVRSPNANFRHDIGIGSASVVVAMSLGPIGGRPDRAALTDGLRVRGSQELCWRRRVDRQQSRISADATAARRTEL